jgi:hypothetical protein
MRKIIFLFLLVLSSTTLSGQTRISDIATPDGFSRIQFADGSYAHWLQRLPLKSEAEVLTYKGESFTWSWPLYNILAVVDKPLYFTQDLEQCADYAMRFWADYHYETGQLAKLYLFNYEGKKIRFSDAGVSYRAFLRKRMAYSNSFSLKSGTRKLNREADLIPGDMFVQNKDGGIGHVSVVVDAAENAAGERIYLIGYSYMPAQEFHLENADGEYAAWFSKADYLDYLSGIRFNRYGPATLHRFTPGP